MVQRGSASERAKKALNRLSANLQSGYLPVDELHLHETGIRGWRLKVLVVVVVLLWICAVCTLICNTFLMITLRMHHRGMDWVQLVPGATVEDEDTGSNATTSKNIDHVIFTRSPLQIDTLVPQKGIRSYKAQDLEVEGENIFINAAIRESTGGHDETKMQPKVLPTSLHLHSTTCSLTADDFVIQSPPLQPTVPSDAAIGVAGNAGQTVMASERPVFRLSEMEFNLPSMEQLTELSVDAVKADRFVSQLDQRLHISSPSEQNITIDGNNGVNAWGKNFILATPSGDLMLKSEIGSITLTSSSRDSPTKSSSSSPHLSRTATRIRLPPVRRGVLPLSSSPAMTADHMGYKIVDHSLSIKILNEAKKQRDELEREVIEDGTMEKKSINQSINGSDQEGPSTSTEKEVVRKSDAIFDEDDFPELGDGQDEYAYEDEYDTAQFEIAPEDEEAFEKFMPKTGGEKMRNLADMIQEKLAERQAELATRLSDAGTVVQEDLDPRFVELFKGVAEVLARYRSGRLPKPFKIIPKLDNWEQVLFLTEPDKWTAASVLQATRIFASNLNAKMTQRFFNLVLLPRLRDDVAQYKRLNFHLYQALKKALFKPSAFFKGILLPLCESGCTLREVTVFGSVLASCSVPMLHAAAAMLKLAEMEYTGANSLFLRVLISKRYALPYRVIDGLVHHFLRFSLDSRKLPVLWHQAFQALADCYGADISGEQKDALLDLTKKHYHPKISPLIRQALASTAQRDEMVKPEEFLTLEETDNPDME